MTVALSPDRSPFVPKVSDGHRRAATTHTPLPGELYNLTDDLAQRYNLYSQHPEKVAELTALLEQIRAKGQVR